MIIEPTALWSGRALIDPRKLAIAAKKSGSSLLFLARLIQVKLLRWPRIRTQKLSECFLLNRMPVGVTRHGSRVFLVNLKYEDLLYKELTNKTEMNKIYRIKVNIQAPRHFQKL